MKNKYIKAGTDIDKATFVHEFGEFLSENCRAFGDLELIYTKVNGDKTVEVNTPDGSTWTASYGEFVTVYVNGRELYDINVAATSNWGMVIDIVKYLQRDF